MGKILALFKSLRAFVRVHVLKQVRARCLYLEITHRCNLACVACYTGAGREKADVLTFEEQKSVMRQAREMGVRSVSLSGSGEPLLCKHFFALVDYAGELGMSAVIFTNGTCIDAATAAALVSRNVLTFFKLYSLDADVFDRMVGRRKAYEWTQHRYVIDGQERTQMIPSGLQALLKAQQSAGRSDLVRVETLVTKINVEGVAKIARFCTECKIGFFMETPVFKGRAMENYERIAVSAAEYAALYRELAAILGKDHLLELKNGSCSVEKNPVVWTDGRIGLCSSRGGDIGNVRDESLKTLFLKARRFKQKEDRMIRRHAREGRYFRTCPSRQLCELKYDLPCDY
jgi:MoaA/NifB/PqqE/SkfB family radical SAM enzyme